LGEGHVVAREGIDAVERDARGDPVIAVGAAEVVGAPRVLRDEQVGLPLPDLSRDVAPQGAGVLHLAVGVAEELGPRDAERARGISLLLLADLRQPLGGHRAVARALVAVGDDHVRHLAAFLDQLRDRAARSELRVVRMRRHHHHPLDPVAHASLLCGVEPAHQHTDSERVARPGYNRAMPKAVGRRLGTAVLVGLVAGVLLLALLAALLSPRRAAAAEANRVAALATLAAAALVLWGSFAALANVAEILRVRRWQAAVLAAALALLAGEWRPRRARARPVLVGVLLV